MRALLQPVSRRIPREALDLVRDLELAGGGILESDPRTTSRAFLLAENHGLIQSDGAGGASYFVTQKGREHVDR